jgi:hypothetical protein
VLPNVVVAMDGKFENIQMEQLVDIENSGWIIIE